MVRRFGSALALGLLVAGLVATPVLAKADKVDLVPVTGLSGGGSVIFNNSSGANNLEVTVQLKGAPAAATYDVYLVVDCVNYQGAPVGTITTNPAGNATFHVNAQVDERAAGRHSTRISRRNRSCCRPQLRSRASATSLRSNSGIA